MKLTLPSSAKLLTAAVAVTVAVPLSWMLLRRDVSAAGLIDNTVATDRILDDRAATGAAAGGERIPEAEARSMFLTDPRRFVWDPDCYYRYRPGHVQVRRWEEHPDGEWTRRTNAQGLREDSDARLLDAELAVLVSGDSHTDGACNNEESFANQLETRLRTRDPERRIEVLNAGVVGYSFHNHLGVLQRFLAEEPDVFVLCVYGGNDFLEVLRPHHYLSGTTYPPRRAGYWGRIEAAKEVSQTFVAQSLNQALYLQEHPEELEVALDGALTVTAQIAQLCRTHDVRLVVSYLPPAYEAGWPELDGLIARAMQVLDLTESDLFVTRRLKARFFEGLRDLGVEPIDLGPALRASEERCYWKYDLHLNVVGHGVVADALEQHLLAGGGELGPLLATARPDGPAEERDKDGRLVAQGNWLNGRRDGEWVLSYPDGAERCRGSWSEGQREGVWTWRYEGGQLMQRGAFDGGARVGPWREWYRDGAPRRLGQYLQGKPDGIWREWHPGEIPGGGGLWSGGMRQGPWETSRPDGSLEMRVHYRDDQLHGDAERSYPDGVVQWSGRFERGQRVGDWTFFHPAGDRQAEGAYRAGQRTGAWRFWKANGTIDAARSGTYVEGERAGT